MLISTSEYSYSMSYLPGKKNILADYGTRQIPQIDWEPPLDDPLELNPFLDWLIISQMRCSFLSLPSTVSLL